MRAYAGLLTTKRSFHENTESQDQENRMTLGTILLIVLILLLTGRI